MSNNTRLVPQILTQPTNLQYRLKKLLRVRNFHETDESHTVDQTKTSSNRNDALRNYLERHSLDCIVLLQCNHLQKVSIALHHEIPTEILGPRYDEPLNLHLTSRHEQATTSTPKN